MKKSTKLIPNLRKTFAVIFATSLILASFACKTETNDTTAPAEVRDLTVTAKNSSVLLTWTDPSDDDLFGIEITYTSDSSTRSAISAMQEGSVFVAPKTQTATISNLTNGTSYTFTLKAMDTSGNKSSGVKSTSVSPKAVEVDASEPLSIALTTSVPQENGYTGNKSNTSVTVTANITTANTVKKVVYKKDGSINAATLLADTDATELTVDENDNKKWTFTLTATDETANGTYTVAAIDEAGREETAQIEIDNFDFTPPTNVTNVSSSVSTGSAITLKWTDPSDDDFDHVLISYSTNDGTSDSEESDEVSVVKGTQTYTLSDVDGNVQYYKFTIKSVDELGNTSRGRVMRSTGNSEFYDFHETVTSAGTTTINGTEYKLVYFGDWPRTVKEDEIGVDESASLTMGGNTYYLGSDNNYYAKCTENAFESDYTYSDGTTVAQSSANSTKYFKVEPITWRVLTEDYNSTGKALLLAEEILTANVSYNGTYYDRTQGSTTIYANNYKYSNMRAYLNGTQNQFVTDGEIAWDSDVDWTDKGFLQSAFTTDAQRLIETTAVDNSESSTNPASNASQWNSGINKYACDDTEDKIFLFSEKEVTTTTYGFDSSYADSCNARIRMPTDWAKANYARQCTTDSYGCWWWLRSPCYDYNKHVWNVNWYRGNASGSNLVTSEAGGIVPALLISLQ